MTFYINKYHRNNNAEKDFSKVETCYCIVHNKQNIAGKRNVKSCLHLLQNEKISFLGVFCKINDFVLSPFGK